MALFLLPMHALAREKFLKSYVPGLEMRKAFYRIDSLNNHTPGNYTSIPPTDLEEVYSSKGIQRRTLWIELELINRNPETKKVLLAVRRIDSLFFYLHYRESDSLKISGEYVYNPAHRINEQRRTATLYVPAHDTCKVIIRMVPVRFMHVMNQMRVEAFEEDDFVEYSGYLYYYNRWELNKVIIFISILLFQLLFVSFQGILMRRSYYIYYICYIFLIGLYYLARFEVELNWDLFFTRFPYLAENLNNLLLYLPFFFYYRFARDFCEVKRYNFRLAQQIQYAERFILMYCSLVLLSDLLDLSRSIKFPLMFGGIIVFLLMSVYFLYRVFKLNNVIARILVAGSVFALVSSIFANLLAYVPFLWDLTDVQPLTITMAGVVIETVIFSAGLVFKSRQMEMEQLSVQRRLVQETEEKRKLEKEYFEERNRIASDLHDDIGATLSSIGIYSDAAKNKIRKGDHAKALTLLEQIGVNARETMSNMSDIVWAINPLNDDHLHLADKMESYALGLLQSRDIQLKLNLQRNRDRKEMPLNVRKNIFLLFKEAINNIVKYAEAGRVEVWFEENDAGWTLRIDDDGIGFDSRVMENAGNGLRNMQYRASEAGGQVEIKSGTGGTSVVLNIPRRGD
ncbi:MAG: sensor histidine kinase [Bacteroidia bacterium]|nr:sensor histidine kinase [Bacteroidia bacterium]